MSTSTQPSEAASTLVAANRRLTDLREFQLPRLRTCRGSLSLHRELADELRGDLEGVRRSLELARELGETLYESNEFFDRLHQLDQEYLRVRSEYRQALVSSKHAITSSARSRRHELLLSRNSNDELMEPGLDSQKASARVETSGDDALQTKTNEVTDALRRTTTIMQAELERSVLSVQMLDESTRTLRLTQSLYDNYTSLLHASGVLVKAIEKADWYDRLLIFSAFFFFLLVVGWVLKRRILDKVAGGIFWWAGGSWKLVKMGLGAKGVTAAVPAVPAAAAAAGTTIAGQKIAPGMKHGAVTLDRSYLQKEKSLLAELIPPNQTAGIGDSAVSASTVASAVSTDTTGIHDDGTEAIEAGEVNARDEL